MRFNDFISQNSKSKLISEGRNVFQYEISDFEKGTAKQQKALKAFIAAGTAFVELCNIVGWHADDEINGWLQMLSDNEDIPYEK